MANDHLCVGGDGGPLIVLQAAAVPLWQGARNFEHSVMNGGQIETDYDFICDWQGTEYIRVITRYGRDLLVLWNCEWGAIFLPPDSLSLPPDALVLTRCFHEDDLPDILPKIMERIQQGEPHCSLLFNAQDTTLRLQVGADSAEPSYLYDYMDISVSSGMKRCDFYLVEYDSSSEEVILIHTHSESDF
jgi:hypothetical protein